jgi:hypothetical protein
MKQVRFLTRQQIFDQAAIHLLEQGKAALLPRGGGAYYGGDSTCPVGDLISARDYATSMEGVPVRFVAVPPDEVPLAMRPGVEALRRALIKAGIDLLDPGTVRLLARLQTVHDAFGVWEWRWRLKSIAVEFGLLDRVLSLAA